MKTMTAGTSNTQRMPVKEVTPMEVIGFVVVVVLWVTFGAAVFFSESSIHEVWSWFRDQSLLVQVPLGVMFLPWLLGMWIWESSWPVFARALIVIGLAWGTVYAFFPWKNVS